MLDGVEEIHRVDQLERGQGDRGAGVASARAAIGVHQRSNSRDQHPADHAAVGVAQVHRREAHRPVAHREGAGEDLDRAGQELEVLVVGAGGDRVSAVRGRRRVADGDGAQVVAAGGGDEEQIAIARGGDGEAGRSVEVDLGVHQRGAAAARSERERGRERARDAASGCPRAATQKARRPGGDAGHSLVKAGQRGSSQGDRAAALPTAARS